MMDQAQVWLLAVSAAAAIAIIFLILIITLFVKLGKMKKRYAALMNGERNVNMEELLIGIQAKLNELGEQGGNTVRQIADMKQTMQMMQTMQSKIGIHRYNAFGEAGGADLSFTLAMLNELADGVVLTGIYGRDQTYIYAKPIQKGASTYTLSPEEKEAITRTLQQG
jgi:hypothetical protein